MAAFLSGATLEERLNAALEPTDGGYRDVARAGSRTAVEGDGHQAPHSPDQATRVASRPIPPQTALFDQVARVLHRLAEGHPLLLVLDDLHWADRASVGLLFHLSRRLAGSRILVLGAYRSGELAPGPDDVRHPLASVVNEILRDQGDVAVDLDRADRRAFVTAVMATEPHGLGPEFEEQLYQRTGGHPLFTMAVLYDLIRRDELVRDEAGRWVTGPALDWRRVPPQVEGVVAERLARLPAADRRLLAAASVQGETFLAEVAADACGMEVAEAVRRLGGALSRRHRLVRGDRLELAGDRGAARFRFRHALFRQYVYDRLDSMDRAGLHGATGQALEVRCRQAAGCHCCADAGPSRLAWHFERAEDRHRAAALLSGSWIGRLPRGRLRGRHRLLRARTGNDRRDGGHQ